MKIFQIRFNAKYVTRIVSFVICLTLMAYLIYNLGMMWFYRAIITLVGIIILAFVFKVFNIKDITNFVSAGIKEKEQ